MQKLKWFSAVCFLACLPAFAAPASGNLGALEAQLQAYQPETLPSGAVEFSYFIPYFPNYGSAEDRSLRRPGTGFRLAFDWMPLVGPAGKLGFGLGIGYGRTARISRPRPQPAVGFLEVYPLDADISYRFDYVENQILVPFLRAGANLTFLTQESFGSLQRYAGFTYGGGVALCLDFLDSVSASLLNASSGIDGTYLLVQYRRHQTLTPGQGPDLSRDEWQASLRMEF